MQTQKCTIFNQQYCSRLKRALNISFYFLLSSSKTLSPGASPCIPLGPRILIFSNGGLGLNFSSIIFQSIVQLRSSYYIKGYFHTIVYCGYFPVLVSWMQNTTWSFQVPGLQSASFSFIHLFQGFERLEMCELQISEKSKSLAHS